jgi:hypothetical protein
MNNELHPAEPAKTRSAVDGEEAPRQAHERDESSDSGTTAPRDVMRQAEADLASGKQQTDRGEATDAAYQKQKSAAA